MTTQLSIKEHDSPPELYAALCKAFPEQEKNGTRWVAFTVDGVELTFFAPRNDKPTSVPA